MGDVARKGLQKRRSAEKEKAGKSSIQRKRSFGIAFPETSAARVAASDSEPLWAVQDVPFLDAVDMESQLARMDDDGSALQNAGAEDRAELPFADFGHDDFYSSEMLSMVDQDCELHRGTGPFLHIVQKQFEVQSVLLPPGQISLEIS